MTISEGQISKKVPMIGAGMLKNAKIIGPYLIKNPPLRGTHDDIHTTEIPEV